MTNAAKHPKLEYHRGIDYAVIMRPEDTTETALLTINADAEQSDYWGNLLCAASQQYDALKLAEEMLTAIADGKTFPAREYMDNLHAIRRAIDSVKGDST